jgi:hypothetical protein
MDGVAIIGKNARREWRIVTVEAGRQTLCGGRRENIVDIGARAIYGCCAFGRSLRCGLYPWRPDRTGKTETIFET